MFKKILIANRGEIACRVASTARKMGIQTVAVYSKADANAKHVASCDEAVYIGANEGNTAQDSYLRADAVLQAALKTGAKAIHPGYGFLSENEAFAAQCAEAGLVFIGPPASAITAMGLKAQSKRLMEQAGVPLVPGYHGADQSPDLLKAEAAKIGYPVLIKASAGGGGKGMRVVEKAQDFDAALISCQREAKNSFGDDAVLIEKYVQKPRHIEIQVFGDTHGNYVHLYERDCSVQRRHQKVLEEAPAPGMTAALRQAMGSAALEAARAVGYVGAGTVEFIVEQPSGYGLEDAKFYFMEMNTRLQVEHPVTEAITGLDLVEWQLRVAAGETLPLAQDQIGFKGHAIEARICAENPDKAFLPAIGSLQVYRKPTHGAFEISPVRVDDGVRPGDAISPYYDSMIAKLIVHGATRQEALAKLDRSLAQTQIVGLQSNVQFLRHVLATDSFAQARLDTALITREEKVLFQQEKMPIWQAVCAGTASILIAEKISGTQDPFSQRDGWQPFGQRTRLMQWLWHDISVSGLLSYPANQPLHLKISMEGQTLEGDLQFEALDQHRLAVQFAGQKLEAAVDAIPEANEQIFHIFTAGAASKIIAINPYLPIHNKQSHNDRFTTPMPGKVVSYAVQAGDAVKAGQTLAVMEAMKMEHTIAAPRDGVVEQLLYMPGDQVAEGAELLRLQG